MSKLVWDKVGDHFYETGVDKVVLFPMSGESSSDSAYGEGVAWNGITQVSESRSGADETKLYANNNKYLGLRAVEEFGGTITAYTYPDEWKLCDGSASPVAGLTLGQQSRKPFGLAYRTLIGNDTEGDSLGYILHLVYNSTASPSNRDYSTKNDSPEAVEFSWEFTSTPVAVTGYAPTCCLEIDSRTVTAEKLKKIEDSLYGTENTESKLMTPDEVIAALKVADQK